MESVSTGVTIYYNQSAPFLIRSFVHTTREVDSARIRDKSLLAYLLHAIQQNFL
jgi:hypothetical protein